jgi:hypothetical protein
MTRYLRRQFPAATASDVATLLDHLDGRRPAEPIEFASDRLPALFAVMAVIDPGTDAITTIRSTILRIVRDAIDAGDQHLPYGEGIQIGSPDDPERVVVVPGMTEHRANQLVRRLSRRPFVQRINVRPDTVSGNQLARDRAATLAIFRSWSRP